MDKDVIAREPPDEHRPIGAWQWPVGLFVALGSLATAAYAIVETFWG